MEISWMAIGCAFERDLSKGKERVKVSTERREYSLKKKVFEKKDKKYYYLAQLHSL